MRLATARLRDRRTRAVRLEDGEAVEIEAEDIGDLLESREWMRKALEANGARHDLQSLDYAPLVPRPSKVICVGLNYRGHIRETGNNPPRFPTLFAKYPEALIGANDPLSLPAVSVRLDWEAELAVIVGQTVRNASTVEAKGAIAGYAVLNDVSARDWQQRTTQWLQGKTFERTCPFGPWLVTADECEEAANLEIGCAVNGRTVQAGNTSDLVFGPAALVAYVSTILTLTPGDVIATGTPAGIGDTRTPPEYLFEGAILSTYIAGLGECHNVCVKE